MGVLAATRAFGPVPTCPAHMQRERERERERRGDLQIFLSPRRESAQEKERERERESERGNRHQSLCPAVPCTARARSWAQG